MWQLDESALSADARALLRQLFAAVEAAAMEQPVVKTHPETLGVNDLRDRVRRELVVPALQRDEDRLDRQNVLFNLLEDCLARHPEHTTTVTTVRQPPAINLFPRRPDVAFERLACFEKHLYRFLRADGRQPGFGGLSHDAQAGLMLALLVLRAGVCSRRVLAALMRVVDQPLRVAGDWLYLHASLFGDPKRPPEHRRVFLDVVSAAVYLRLDPGCVEHVYPQTIRDAKPSIVRQKQLTAMNRCYKALLNALDATQDPNVPHSLKALCDCRLDRMRLQVNAVLSDYACGELRSTSFQERAWLRWLGHRPATDDSHTPRREEALNSGLSERPEPDTVPAKALAAEYDTTGHMTRLRAIIQKPARERANAIHTHVAALTNELGAHAPPTLLAKWVEQMLTQRRHTGRFLRPSTVLYMVGLFGARMLASFTHSVNELPDDDELHDIYLEILEQSTSDGHEARLASVIRDFDRFLRQELGRESGASLEGLPTSTGHYLISANALSFSEFEALQVELAAEESPLGSEERQHIACAVTTLSFWLGLRRSEVLGLRRRDAQIGRPAELIVRNNAFRSLKTPNARRRVPLDLTPEGASQVEIAGLDAKPDDPLFRLRGDSHPVPDHLVIPQIKHVLYKVTGDPGVHYHHLRHSTASWVFLALMADQVPVANYVHRAPFLADVLKHAGDYEQHLASDFHPLGSRAYIPCELLGHGNPATTFLHYVHVLDLLLFMGVDPSRHRGDQQLQLAALGQSPTSRLSATQPAEALRGLMRRFPERVLCHPTDEMPSRPVQRTDTPSPSLTFDKLKAHLDAWNASLTVDDMKLTATLDVPPPGAPRQAAARTLKLLNRALNHDEAAARRAIALLDKRRLRNSDWSSINEQELAIIRAGLATGDGEDGLAHLDIQLLQRLPGRKRRIVHMTPERARALLADQTGGYRFRVRVHDTRPRSSRKRPDHRDRRRQRTQYAVSWAIRAANDFLPNDNTASD